MAEKIQSTSFVIFSLIFIFSRVINESMVKLDQYIRRLWRVSEVLLKLYVLRGMKYFARNETLEQFR